MYISKRNTIDGVLPIGSNLLGICTSSSSSATKTVTLTEFDTLVEGVTVHVYFQYANTASSPVLKVGSSDGKSIRCNGNFAGVWDNGSVVSFTYYQGYWNQNDHYPGGASYSLSISGNVITLTGSDGSSSAVTIPASQSSITQSGTGTISGFTFYYEYYSNGTKKLWIAVTGTTAISTSGGGGYVSEMKSLNISALSLTTIYNIQMQFAYGYYAGSSHIYSYDTSNISWYFWNAVSVTNRAYTMFIEIVGA